MTCGDSSGRDSATLAYLGAEQEEVTPKMRRSAPNIVAPFLLTTALGAIAAKATR
jgi:hypothetical protein